MIKHKRYFALILIMVLLISGSVFTIAEETNLYPNPESGLQKLKETRYKYLDVTDYFFQDLQLNGSSVKGYVINKLDNSKAIIQVYTLVVEKEGMVSINLTTSDNLDQTAKLDVAVAMNDPRNGSITYNNDVQTTLSDKPDHAYVEKNYVYYAYPGVYYFDVSGKNRIGSDYVKLNYSISATQEIYDEEFIVSNESIKAPIYPNYLGTTTLSESLSIKSTKSMKSWRLLTTDGGLSGVYTNSQDKFTFTASKTGTVNVKIINFKTRILDTYLAAYHSSAKSTAFQPVIKVNVSKPNVASPLRTECYYGLELIDTFKVVAGETYNVEIIGSNHPMKYSLDFSYGSFGSTGSTKPSSGVNTASASSWALTEINQSIAAGLQTPKMMNSNFKSYATREEFAELIMKLYDQLGGKSVSGSSSPFSDTNNTEIIRAKNAGIINGTSATSFGPNENLTREQLCVMILRTLDATKTQYNMNVTFQKAYSDQSKISNWALTSVRTLNSYKIINGTGENLDPQTTVTKEVAILMMYRAYEMFK